ncbi:MAG TPA: TIGR03986 family CRISPR-associated RAMP protein, partial [Arcobacter sp.]|nr:TIGR03986 family CRISPR-associated RAMP protein [Arcobacter sp.]
EKVFFPDWAEDVSHDVPFEDGESGEIDITITAKSPIFIRDHKKPEQFCQHDGKYYIPGSSVKGMVRNVLEIMSFSKMKPFNDDTYAFRDLRNDDLYMQHFKIDKIYCGWLRKLDNEYIIEDCGFPGWIEHTEINPLIDGFSCKFDSTFQNNKPEYKTAKYKYNLINKNVVFKKEKFSQKGTDYNRCQYRIDSNGKEAELVFTGQTKGHEGSGRTGDGQKHEFLFFLPANKNILQVESKIFENLKFAYFDGKYNESKDWAVWKDELASNRRVPVFFQKEDNGSVLHMGLSYLYKLPYKHSIKDGVFVSHHDIVHRPDLGETIFGYTTADNNQSLKGRVQFSHFLLDQKDNNKKDENVTVILGSPKASYYPIYIRQKLNSSNYSTLMDDDAILSGRKRYPIHKTYKPIVSIKTEDLEKFKKVSTTFTPLKSHVTFGGKLRFHNIKKSELGALLSAITFHNNSECYHNIGMAKALGLGKIKINISKIKIDNNIYTKDKIDNTIKIYLKMFETELSKQIKDWANKAELKELFTMARDQDNQGNSVLEYISSIKDFTKLKANKNDTLKTIHYLQRYSQLNNIKVNKPESLIDKDDIYNQELVDTIEEKHREMDFLKAKETKDINIIKLFLYKYKDSKNDILEIKSKLDDMLNHLLCDNKNKSKMLQEKLLFQENKNKNKEQEQRRNNLIDMYERIGSAKIRRIHSRTRLPNVLNIEKDYLDLIIQNLNIQMQNNSSIADKDMLRIIDKILRDDYNILLIEALLVEKNVTFEQLLQFAEDENIDIEENSKYLSLDIAKSIIEYMAVE